MTYFPPCRVPLFSAKQVGSGARDVGLAYTNVLLQLTSEGMSYADARDAAIAEASRVDRERKAGRRN
jgi:hypothetical protein